MQFKDVYDEYYEKIFHYCHLKLGNRQLAEDCTQEVFFLFSQKMNKLPLTTNVPAWLYKTSKNIIRNYYHKNKGEISLEETEDIAVEENKIESATVFDDILEEDEIRLLKEYYVFEETLESMAKSRGKSQKSLYQQIWRIRQKVIQYSDKLHNLLKK